MTENARAVESSLRYSTPSNVDPKRARPYHDAENLRVAYHELGWNQTRIAEFYGVDQATISRSMKQAGVETNVGSSGGDE